MDEFDRHVSWILSNSTVPRIRRGVYRRVNLMTFPYYIAYIVRDDILWIIAVCEKPHDLILLLNKSLGIKRLSGYTRHGRPVSC